MKKIYLLILALMFGSIISGCGYTVAGYDSKTKFYIENITNSTIDTTYTNLVQEVIDGYFIIYGEMASYERANYILSVNINKVTISDNIVSATNESVNSNIYLDIAMIITDKSGREVFSYTIKPSGTFSVTQNISQTLKGRNQTIRTIITDNLDIFRNNFNAKFQ